MLRIRLTFSKTNAMRYTGHLDLHKSWERTFRRARLPLAYTQGFSPHPRLNLGAALPLGYTGQGEWLDAWLEHDLDLAEARAALESALPPGLQLQDLAAVPDDQPALQTQIDAAEYRVTFLDPPPDLAERLTSLLAAPEIRRTRRDKSYDLRPLIEMAVLEDAQRLRLRLTAREGATGRPDEVVEALGLPARAARYHRLQLLVK